MKRQLILLGFFCALAAALIGLQVCTTYAQSEAGVYRVGIVDLQEVMDNYSKRQDEVSKLEEQVNARKAEITQMQESFEKKLEDYKAQRDGLTELQQETRESELDREALQLESEIRKTQTELERKQRRLKDELIQDIVDAVDEIGHAEDYHLILEADPEVRTGVLYYTKSIEITGKVIERLNSR